MVLDTQTVLVAGVSPFPPQVKKGLEKLYRRVEKEISEEELQVVWGAMQEAFMEQYRRFEVSERADRQTDMVDSRYVPRTVYM